MTDLCRYLSHAIVIWLAYTIMLLGMASLHPEPYLHLGICVVSVILVLFSIGFLLEGDGNTKTSKTARAVYAFNIVMSIGFLVSLVIGLSGNAATAAMVGFFHWFVAVIVGGSMPAASYESYTSADDDDDDGSEPPAPDPVAPSSNFVVPRSRRHWAFRPRVGRRGNWKHVI